MLSIALFLPLLTVVGSWVAAPTRLRLRADELPVVVIQPPARDEPRVEVETFVLERVDAAGRARMLGIARCLRRTAADERQLELETAWIVPARSAGESAGLVRIFHVEAHSAHGRRLVWREVGAGLGRTLIAEAEADGRTLRTSEWTARDTCIHELAFPRAAALPLELLERARAGHWTNESLLVFDPLAREVARFTAHAPISAGRPVDNAASLRARVCEVRRSAIDGSAGALVTRWSFEGTRLCGFELASGARARAIDRREYDVLEARLGGASITSARVP